MTRLPHLGRPRAHRGPGDGPPTDRTGPDVGPGGQEEATTSTAPAPGRQGEPTANAAPARGGQEEATTDATPAPGAQGEPTTSATPASDGQGEATTNATAAPGGQRDATTSTTPAPGRQGEPTTNAAPAPGRQGEATTNATAAPRGQGDATTSTTPASGRQGEPTTSTTPVPGTEPGRGASREETAGVRGGRARRRGFGGRLVPAVCAALLVLAGCGFFYGAHQARSTPSAANRALTDAEETTRVAGDVDNALARVFSYTPDGLEATERAARSVLAGRAQRQYTELMERIRADVAARRVTLSTQAVRTGVIELDGDSARLLVFLDQISHRGKAGTTSAAAQLTVTARREDDQWRIVDIKTR